jgi:hypothetical protein
VKSECANELSTFIGWGVECGVEPALLRFLKGCDTCSVRLCLFGVAVDRNSHVFVWGGGEDGADDKMSFFLANAQRQREKARIKDQRRPGAPPAYLQWPPRRP